MLALNHFLLGVASFVAIWGFAAGSIGNEFGGIYFPGSPPLDIVCSESDKQSLLVITGENYYGIISHKLAEIKWKAVAVNGNQVFVNTLHNKTFTTNFNGLSDKQREVIQKIRSEHLMNLNGLGLTRSVSPPSSGAANNYYGSGAAGASRANSYGSPGVDSISTSAYGATSGNYGGAGQAGGYNATPVAYNYYNLGHESCTLKEFVYGDVYSFSLQGNILDIFSSTIMVHQKGSESILYRDHRYFSYARQYMPLEINRFFLAQDSVIFVYNDATILVKSSMMLNSVELELVLGARETIKELVKGLFAAADIAAHSYIGSTTEKPAEILHHKDTVQVTSVEELEAAEQESS